MSKYYHSQESCKREFSDLCEAIVTRIKDIDNETPWSEVEPQWWLDMMEMERIANKYQKEKHE